MMKGFSKRFVLISGQNVQFSRPLLGGGGQGWREEGKIQYLTQAGLKGSLKGTEGAVGDVQGFPQPL